MERVQCLVSKDIDLFLLGGNCSTTILSNRTGKRFTYLIQVRLDEDRKRIPGDEQVYFIKVDKGNFDFIYAGMLKVNFSTKEIQYSRGRKGNLDMNDLSIKALTWVIKRSLTGGNTDEISVYHMGKCGVCGRRLKDPISIQTGLGPKCGGRLCRNKDM